MPLAPIHNYKGRAASVSRAGNFRTNFTHQVLLLPFQGSGFEKFCPSVGRWRCWFLVRKLFALRNVHTLLLHTRVLCGEALTSDRLNYGARESTLSKSTAIIIMLNLSRSIGKLPTRLVMIQFNQARLNVSQQQT